MLYMYYIITQYVYVRYNRHWQTDGWIDRQLNTEQTLIDDWQMNRWTDWQMDWETGYLGVTDSTEVWRFLEFSSCSFSFWEYSRGWYCVVALRGYFQSVCVPSSTNSGIDYNNKTNKTYIQLSICRKSLFYQYITTSYLLEFCIKGEQQMHKFVLTFCL